MASQGYRDWLAAGEPYTLIRPAAAVEETLRGYGLTVYDKPNQAHLTASTPEDHTSFSATSWPTKNARWRAHALDVMLRNDSAAARKENADIARQLIKDRDAGVPGAMWIKYINWTDEHGDCQQVRWMDDAHQLQHTTRGSTDKGHIHISGRSDCADDDRADGYDPIARMAGLDGGDMDFNQDAKLTAVFDAKDTVSLDTDGTVDGKGARSSFPVPLVALIKSNHAAVMAAVSGRPVEGEVLEGGAMELSDAEVDRIAARLAEKLGALRFEAT